MRFFCDQMLGTLAIWLRFFGYDTTYIKQEISDDDILVLAQEEQRILLTRDKEMVQRANKRDIIVIFIDTIDLDEQLYTVFHKAKEIPKWDQVLSRCSLCNRLLKNVLPEQIKDRVPPRVFENQQEFWVCSCCKRVYWKGSHYDMMIKKIGKMIEELNKEDN